MPKSEMLVGYNDYYYSKEELPDVIDQLTCGRMLIVGLEFFEIKPGSVMPVTSADCSYGDFTYTNWEECVRLENLKYKNLLSVIFKRYKNVNAAEVYYYTERQFLSMLETVYGKSIRKST